MEVETSLEFRVLVDVIKKVVEEHSGVWFDLIQKDAIPKCNKYNNILHTGIASFPTGTTLYRWFNMIVTQLGYISNNLIFQKSGSGATIKVWHNGSLDVSRIESLYRRATSEEVEEVEADNIEVGESIYLGDTADVEYTPVLDSISELVSMEIPLALSNNIPNRYDYTVAGIPP